MPGIYLSGFSGGSDETLLRFLGISHVIRILDGKSFTKRIRYDIITSTDIEAPDRDLNSVEKILTIGIQSSYNAYINNKYILIHCLMGISRSASVAIGLIMKIKDISYDEAFSIVKSKRPKIKPFRGFSEFLKFTNID